METRKFEELPDNFFYVQVGEDVITLNKRLLKEKGLDKDISRIEKLKDSHKEKLRLFKLMKETNDKETLRELSACVEEIEFIQQELWGFPINRNFHRWWEVPKCACSKLDNMENIGTEYRIINEDCPVHGK